MVVVARSILGEPGVAVPRVQPYVEARSRPQQTAWTQSRNVRHVHRYQIETESCHPIGQLWSQPRTMAKLDRQAQIADFACQTHPLSRVAERTSYEHPQQAG